MTENKLFSRLWIFAKNSTAMLAANVAVTVLMFGFIRAAAQRLGPDGFGTYTLALTISTLLVSIIDFGSSLLVVRQVARNRTTAGAYLVNGGVLRGISTVVMVSVLGLVVYVVDKSSSVKIAILVSGLSAVFLSWTEFLLAFFNAFERMEFTALIKLLDSLLLTVGGTLYLSRFSDPTGLFWVYVTVRCGLMLLSLRLVLKILPVRLNIVPSQNFSKDLFNQALPFGVFVAFGLIYFQIDTVLLSAWSGTGGETKVGIYQAALKPIVFLMIIPDMLSRAMFPVLADYASQSYQQVQKLLGKVLGYLFVFGLPLSVGVLILGDKIVLFLYQSEYLSSVIILRILSLIIPVRFCSYALGVTLSATDRQKDRTFSAGLSAAINIVLNLVFIPFFGFVSVSIVRVTTEMVLFGCYCFFVSRNLFKIPFKAMLLKPAFAAMLMGIGLLVFRNAHMLTLIAFSVLFYLVLLLLMKGLPKEDLSFVRRAILQRRSNRV